MKTMPKKVSLLDRVRVAAATAAMTLVALPVNAATTSSFPQNPLLTGGNAVPPNILLILDDSGSMSGGWMPAYRAPPLTPFPTDKSSLGDNVTDRSYVSNTIYYDPRITYQPWRTASTDLTVRLGQANFRNVASSDTSPTPIPIDLDLVGSSNSYFYVPNVADPGTITSNYDKYRIGSSNSADSVNGGAVQKQRLTTLPGGTIPALNASTTTVISKSSCTAVSTGSPETLAIAIAGGGKNADLYVYSSSGCTLGLLASDTSNGDPKTATLSFPPATVYFQVINSSTKSKTNAIAWSAVATSWTNATPSGRSQADELQNFANWYQYHRTRNKMAKAGASEAFGRLGKTYRVGFDTIWNGGGTTTGSMPQYPIPVGTDDGLFEDKSGVTNRTDFYRQLQSAGASGNTPLKGALQRAGRYFSVPATTSTTNPLTGVTTTTQNLNSPWRDSSGNELTCRQNYAILTTDGYWNNTSGFVSTAINTYSDGSTAGDGRGNVDAGTGYPYQDVYATGATGYTATLADVAYYYWKNDARTDMTNNVRTSADDPASWQHMVTFGVSIGQQGTLNPNNPVPATGWPDPTPTEDATRIDDLWHASINGHGKFVVASNTDKFATALTNALATIDSRTASGSNIASSSTKTDTATLTFVAGFTSGSWVGDMIASPFNAALTGVSDTPRWQLSTTFGSGGVNQDFKNRTVLTSKGATAALFDSNVSNSSDFAARSGQSDAVTAIDNIAYLRGDQSKEIGQTGGTLRKRAWPIGDIVDSSPAYSEDTNTVYIGANDGMLHGIDSNTGKVLFSYVPKGLDFTSMASLSATAYDHHYFVDGQIDVISRANQGNGKNILVGALGRGGRGVFALDVTNPGSMGTSNVLWDNTTQNAATDSDMGYVLAPIRIRKGNGGKTYAFVANGIDSANGSAVLYVYELDANGGIVGGAPHKLVADAGGSGSTNGLMSLGMADLNGDGLVDVVYGGDLNGNVWRWDFTGTSVPSTRVHLFQATDSASKAQPITGGLAVAMDSNGQLFVGFGTGRFISLSDVPGNAGYVSQTQSVYGLIDAGVPIGLRDQLQSRSIASTGLDANGNQTRTFQSQAALTAGKKGWYMDLPAPERVITAPTILSSGDMYWSSVNPATGSNCSSAMGTGFVNHISVFTGTNGGSVGVSTGMPTEVNVTSKLATVGTGDGLKTQSGGIPPPSGGLPSRVNWREIVPNN